MINTFKLDKRMAMKVGAFFSGFFFVCLASQPAPSKPSEVGECCLLVLYGVDGVSVG